MIGTAWTRMLSRGISDVIGLGEVSAEEIQGLEEIEAGHNGKNSPLHDEEEPAMPWTADEFVVADFVHWAGTLGLTLPRLLEVLQGPKLREYTGDKRTAYDLVKAEADRIHQASLKQAKGGPEEKPESSQEVNEEPCWATDLDTLATFTTWVQSLGLTLPQAAAELHVERFSEYKGSKKEAFDIIKAAAARLKEGAAISEAAPPQKPFRWVEDPEVAGAFVEWVYSKVGLSDAEMLEALGEESLDLFGGTQAAAKQLIMSYITKKIAQKHAAKGENPADAQT